MNMSDMTLIYLPALWTDRLSGYSHSLFVSPSLSLSLCFPEILETRVPPANKWSLPWQQRYKLQPLLIMATVAGSQINSPALPQGRANVWTPGCVHTLTLTSITNIVTAAQCKWHPDPKSLESKCDAMVFFSPLQTLKEQKALLALDWRVYVVSHHLSNSQPSIFPLT